MSIRQVGLMILSRQRDIRVYRRRAVDVGADRQRQSCQSYTKAARWTFNLLQVLNTVLRFLVQFDIRHLAIRSLTCGRFAIYHLPLLPDAVDVYVRRLDCRWILPRSRTLVFINCRRPSLMILRGLPFVLVRIG